jgi:hypothetical protein
MYQPDWLAKPVLVPKRNKDWRMCVDYTDLNKTCKKDHFGLPRIKSVVDSTASCSLLSFLDCYFMYHQIPLRVEDQIKTSFITSFGAFCYITMPSDLKVQVQLTRGVYNGVCIHSLGTMLKRTLTTWS